MRIAIVSDIHGNLTAFEAVLKDLRQTSPDLIFHGGDLAQAGSSPVEIIDCIRDLGWPGVVGNADEVLFRPESLTEFSSQMPQLQPLWAAIQETAWWTCDALGAERIAWLSSLPRSQSRGPMTLVHASPQSLWRSPGHDASDAELESIYSPLGQPIAVYAHIHRSFIRTIAPTTIVNTGSVSLSYDADRRAAYLLLDDSKPEIRRVEYDVSREIKALSTCGVPYADWLAKTLETASPQMP